MDGSVYEYQPSFILGFHGCNKAVGEEILSDPKLHLKPSEKSYDWLGSGIYFWEGSVARAWEWAYAKQAYSKLTNGRVGMITTVSPRTSFDNPQYLNCRIMGDLADTTYDYSAGKTWITKDTTATTAQLTTTLYSGVTYPMFGATLARPAESFSLVMALAQKHAMPIPWYETRLGWKMGGSR